MRHLDNDRWRGSFQVMELGRYLYTVTAWVDAFATWRHALVKRIEADQDVSMEMRIGASIVEAAAAQAGKRDGAALLEWADGLRAARPEARKDAALSGELAEIMDRCQVRRHPAICARELAIVVDPERARCSAWYEMFPRSASGRAGRHGSFRDVERLLPYVSELGFDVLYLPPIHPIARTLRKGRNNSVTALPDEPGSPWAIGAAEGGHKSVHPDLGSLEDFRRLVRAAGARGIQVALDVAFQVSPDHPYVKDHPAWFSVRPDGSIQYAENPPKKYQDIYPFNFETEDWNALWEELKSIFDFWIDQGVTIFRVDNPHTKSFPFWEWCIGRIKEGHPETVFLSEAFTRPKIMYRLAKLGFTQSYTYFPWRNTKAEFIEYFTELTTTGVREYFRPNHWTNTPDILAKALQQGGRPAFAVRFVLASTLAANYGIYGPAFELLEDRPISEGSEEYMDSEKYQLREWDLDRAGGLRDLISRINRIRKANPALQQDHNLTFHPTDNDQILCYSKGSTDGENTILVVVNLDCRWKQSGWVSVSPRDLRLPEASSLDLRDLLDDQEYLWAPGRNYVELSPERAAAHIFLARPGPRPACGEPAGSGGRS